MGLDLFEQSPGARDIFHKADEILGYAISKLCFEGPEEELVRTCNVQPAVLTVSWAFFTAAVENGVLPAAAFTAGHSLGEYTALVASGAMGFAQALKVVSIRSDLMEKASRDNPGGKVALIGADEQVAQRVCNASGAQISNLNSPLQTVISGTADSLAVAASVAPEMGVRKVIPLRVSGAFHSRLMQQAADSFGKSLEAFSYEDPRPPVIANATARPVWQNRDVKHELEMQLTRPVLWQKSVEYMLSSGVDTFIEFGPGQVLTGLIRRIQPAARLFNVNTFASLAADFD